MQTRNTVYMEQANGKQYAFSTEYSVVASQNIRLKTPETTSKPMRKMMPTIHNSIFIMRLVVNVKVTGKKQLFVNQSVPEALQRQQSSTCNFSDRFMGERIVTTETAKKDGQRVNGYAPEILLDTLIHLLQLKNDAALCRQLNVSRPLISKIRHQRLPISASILLRMHEESGLSVRELRDLMGDRRRSYRFSHLCEKSRSQ